MRTRKLIKQFLFFVQFLRSIAAYLYLAVINLAMLMISRFCSNIARPVMRAIRIESFGGSEVLKFQESLHIPEPGPKHVLINVKSISINPVDTYIRSGQYSKLPPLPFTPGNDCSGVVERVGTEVCKFKAGDRVYALRSATGTYSTHTLCEDSFVNFLPECVQFREGACLGIAYYTAYRALIQIGGAKPNDLVLVHGASGGVGTACLQLCRMLGIRGVGTVGTEEGRKAAVSSGAETVFNHREEGYVDKLKEFSQTNEGFNVIVENAANINLDKDLELVAAKGCISIVGSKGMASIEVVPRKFMLKECRVNGVFLGNMTPLELSQAHAAILAGAEIQILKPFINQAFELREAAKAHDLLMSGKGGAGKIVLIP